MAGDADLVEQAVQLADDGGDLLGEVARVHCDCRPASGFFNSACTPLTLPEMSERLRGGLWRRYRIAESSEEPRNARVAGSRRSCKRVSMALSLSQYCC